METKTTTSEQQLQLAPEHAQTLALHIATQEAAAAKLELARERMGRFADQLSLAYAAKGLELVGIDAAKGTVTVRPLPNSEAPRVEHLDVAAE